MVIYEVAPSFSVRRHKGLNYCPSAISKQEGAPKYFGAFQQVLLVTLANWKIKKPALRTVAKGGLCVSQEQDATLGLSHRL